MAIVNRFLSDNDWVFLKAIDAVSSGFREWSSSGKSWAPVNSNRLGFVLPVGTYLLLAGQGEVLLENRVIGVSPEVIGFPRVVSGEGWRINSKQVSGEVSCVVVRLP